MFDRAGCAKGTGIGRARGPASGAAGDRPVVGPMLRWFVVGPKRLLEPRAQK